MIQIDAGNSFIKWRRMLQGVVHQRGVVSVSDLASLQDIFCLYALGETVEISSVLSDRETERLCDLARASGVGRVFLAHSMAYLGGLSIAYQDASTLGVDRWLAMLGSHCSSKGHHGLCVIDAGSALTVDCVNLSGGHLGGCIMPGLSLLYRALNMSTGNVRAEGLDLSEFSLGVNTQECVSAGVTHMVLGAIDRLVDVSEGLGLMSVVLTGGDGEKLMPWLKWAGDVRFVPDLVFDGLEVAGCMGGLVEV